MSIALGVNQKGIAAGGGTQGTTGTATTQATGSGIVCFQKYPNASTVSCWTDNYSNTYNSIVLQANAPQGWKIEAYYAQNVAGGAGHFFTQLFADRFTSTTFYWAEITGGSLAALLDTFASGNDTTPFNSPLTTTFANTLVFSVFASNGGGVTTANGGFTLLDSNSGTSSAVMYRNATSIATYDPAPTITTQTDDAWVTVSFKEAASGSTFPGPMYHQRKVLYFI